MPISLRYHEDHDVLEMTFDGCLDARELEASVKEALAVSRRSGTRRLLADCAGLESGPSVVDLYYLAALAATEGPEGWKDAIVRPRNPDAARDVAFWESTALNRGIDAKVFTEREAAMQWLLGKVPPPEPPVRRDGR